MDKRLKGKKVLITAGPTREYLDPVRYISNESSGKMGYALAEVAKKMGAVVTLVSGPTDLPIPSGIKFIPVVSAREMHRAAIREAKESKLILCTAAVADFRPAKTSMRKVKKAKIGRKYELNLIENPDILKSLGKKKTKNQILIGFALETEDIIKNARKKMREKDCDFIVANRVINLGSDMASAVLIDKRGKRKAFKMQPKRDLAEKILKFVAAASSG